MFTFNIMLESDSLCYLNDNISNKNIASIYWTLSRCQILFGMLGMTDLSSSDRSSTEAVQFLFPD